MTRRVTCVECGDALPDERAELGYDYCTKAACQAVRRRGLTITTVGVNKSADAVIVADPDEVRRRGEAGEFGKKDTALGMDYRRGVPAGARRTATAPEGAGPLTGRRPMDIGAGEARPALPRHGPEPAADRRAGAAERAAAGRHRAARGPDPLEPAPPVARLGQVGAEPP